MNLLKSPFQLLLEQSSLSPQMMQAEMIQHGKTPPGFKEGGQPTMTLNIGRNIGDYVNSLSDEEIIKQMKALGHDVLKHQVVEPKPGSKFGPFERTSVVTTQAPAGDPRQFLGKLSESLGQEAIPGQVGKTGYMGGPKAYNWGQFNPQYFVPEGASTAAGNQPIRTAAKNFLSNPALQGFGSATNKGLGALGALGSGASLVGSTLAGDTEQGVVDIGNLGLSLQQIAPKVAPKLLSRTFAPLALYDALRIQGLNKGEDEELKLKQKEYDDYIRRQSPVFIK